ncbi:MAG: SRPBCC domain-containing protein [Acidimicrobiales bacterium]
MAYGFEVSGVVAAPPEEVFRAWLSSESHGAMTGGAAQIDPAVGGAFTAWDGYINGVTLELEPYSRIVQSWRTTEFTPDDPDSMIEVTLEPVDGGTLVTVHHSGVPDTHLGYENGGWKKSYLDPMAAYFSSR